MNLWKKYKDLVTGIHNEGSDVESQGITYWRNQLFLNILMYLLPVGALSIIPGIWISILFHLPVLAACYAFTLLASIVMALVRNINMAVRKATIVFCFYLLSTACLVYTGTEGPVFVYCFAITLFATLIYPAWVAYSTIGVNAIIAVCIFYFNNRHSQQRADLSAYYLSSWTTVCSNLAFLSVFIVTSVNLLFRVLNNTLQKERGLQRDLHASERLYRQMFHKNPLAIVIFDVETCRYLLANNEALKMYGYTPEEFYKMTIFDVRTREEAARLKLELRHGNRSGFKRFGNWNHVTKSGQLLEVEVQSDDIVFEGRAARIVTIRDVTERNKAAKLLSQQTTLLSTIVSNFPNGTVAIIDEFYTIQYIGGQELGRVGNDTAGYVGSNYLNLFPLDERVNILQFLQPVFKGTSNIVEMELDGQVYLRSAVVVDNGDNRKTVVIASQNITEQRLKEKSLTLFETAIINSSDGIAVYDPPQYKGHMPGFAYVNTAFEKMSGYSADELRGQQPTLLLAEGNEGSLPEMRSALAERREFKTELLGVNKNGEKYWHAIHLLPVTDRQGRFLNYMSLHHDITQDKLMEQERERLMQSLSHSESNLRSLINNTNDLIWSADKNLCYIAMNDAVMEVADRRKYNITVGSSVIGPWFDNTNRSHEEWLGFYHKALNGQKHVVDLELVLADQRRAAVNLSFNPIYEKDGSISGVGCFMKDVTAAKLSEERMVRKNAALREIAFLTSHSLRAPLTNIMALVNMLDFEDFSNEDNRQIIQFIHKSALQLDSVIHEIVGQSSLTAIDAVLEDSGT